MCMTGGCPGSKQVNIVQPKPSAQSGTSPTIKFGKPKINRRY